MEKRLEDEEDPEEIKKIKYLIQRHVSRKLISPQSSVARSLNDTAVFVSVLRRLFFASSFRCDNGVGKLADSIVLKI